MCVRLLIRVLCVFLLVVLSPQRGSAAQRGDLISMSAARPVGAATL
jgi:hypothetical protein